LRRPPSFTPFPYTTLFRSAVIAVAQVEVIAAIQQIAPTGVAVGGYRAAAAGHHAAGLQADIVHHGVRDPAKPAALPADKPGERVMPAVGCAAHVVDGLT